MAGGVEIVSAAGLDSQTKLEVGRLMHAALPEYYAALPLTEDETLLLTVTLLDKPTSDVGDAWAAVLGDVVVGAYASVPVDRLGRAQMVGGAEVFRAIAARDREPLQHWLREFSKEFPDPPGGSFYLARIGVSERARGRGVGRAMLEHLASRAEPGQGLSLHVHADNRAAIRLYEKFGFEHAEPRTPPRLVMTRPAR